MSEFDGLYCFKSVKLIIHQSGDLISGIYVMEADSSDIKFDNTKLIELVKKQLDEYFSGKRQEFDFPFITTGTKFQNKVWEELRKIPYGETVSYIELAERCGVPKAARAVGQANNRNKLMIVIPCHRVVGKNGALTGYAGGLALKKFLLELEKKYS